MEIELMTYANKITYSAIRQFSMRDNLCMFINKRRIRCMCLHIIRKMALLTR